MRSARKYLLLITILFSLPFVSTAHLDAGVDKRVGDYYVDFGWKPEELQADQTSLFNLQIIDWETKISPDSLRTVSITINEDEVVFFEVETNADSGTTEFSYKFPRGGKYVLTANFLDTEGNVLTSVNYDLDVSDTLSTYYGGGLILFIVESILLVISLGGLIIMWIHRKKKKRFWFNK